MRLNLSLVDVIFMRGCMPPPLLFSHHTCHPLLLFYNTPNAVLMIYPYFYNYLLNIYAKNHSHLQSWWEH
jgi:hypothetical protein